MVDPDANIPLSLTANECNAILALLTEAPWRIANPLIMKLREQISAAHPDAFAPPLPASKPANGADHAPD